MLVKFISLFSIEISNFFLSCKRKAGLVIIYDDDYCQIILLGSLSRLESYRLVASSGGTNDVLAEYLFWNLETSTSGNLKKFMSPEKIIIFCSFFHKYIKSQFLLVTRCSNIRNAEWPFAKFENLENFTFSMYTFFQ